MVIRLIVFLSAFFLLSLVRHNCFSSREITGVFGRGRKEPRARIHKNTAEKDTMEVLFHERTSVDCEKKLFINHVYSK